MGIKYKIDLSFLTCVIKVLVLHRGFYFVSFSLSISIAFAFVIQSKIRQLDQRFYRHEGINIKQLFYLAIQCSSIGY